MVGLHFCILHIVINIDTIKRPVHVIVVVLNFFNLRIMNTS
jgi:hypothetical protein